LRPIQANLQLHAAEAGYDAYILFYRPVSAKGTVFFRRYSVVATSAAPPGAVAFFRRQR